jgi:hypothetical protein
MLCWTHAIVCRLPVFEGDNPDQGYFYLLTPEEMRQMRFHHVHDPAIVTGTPSCPDGETYFSAHIYVL